MDSLICILKKIIVDSPGITIGLTADHRGRAFGKAMANLAVFYILAMLWNPLWLVSRSVLHERIQ